MATPDVLTTATAPATATGAEGEPPLRPLPPGVAELLDRLAAPLRLVAHLRLVHDVAAQLVAWVERHCPALVLDREAVLFGVATHDIGKTLHPEELTGPGSCHEERGRELLRAHGVPDALARFAGTHAVWGSVPVGVEDLLVSLADKVWKGKRVPDLEDCVVAELRAASGRAAWEEFLLLDAFLAQVADGAEARLAYRAAYSPHAAR
ncbi:HD domain-containing protein [Streptacidiphilus neutrinimicus]|uniref:HD domain-containing protein n=1 Tax=Streptacidiphilus neutrinimicus TaxID=105420 RepID=UPI0005A9899A|nr:HD domain-containing protein [Streptacidiphilus neutrinimicus]